MSSNAIFDISAFQAGLTDAQERVVSIEERRNKGSSRQALFDEAIYELNSELEELQVANEELRIQNEALAQAADNLALERIRYKQLFDLTPDPLITTDAYGNIKEANQAACALLNLKPAHLQHKPLVAFVPTSAKKAFRQGLIKLQQDPEYSFKTLQIVPRSASEPMEVSISTASVDSSIEEATVIRWILKPIGQQAQDKFDSTKRMSSVSTVKGDTSTAKTSAETNKEAAPLQAFVDVQHQLWNLRHEVPKLLDYTVNQLSELIGTHCFLSLLSADKMRLVPMAAASRHQKSDAMLSQFLQAKPSVVSKNVAGKVLKSQQPYTIGSDAHTSNGKPPNAPQGAAKMLMVPLRIDTESLGLITLMREKKQPDFQTAEIKLAQNLADHVALIIQMNNVSSMARQLADSKLANGTFLANLCNEILTPMHALDGFAAMLHEQAQEMDSTEMQTDASCLCEAAALVNKTLVDVLELSRLEIGSLSPKFERIPMPEFLNDIKTDLQNISGQQNVELETGDINMSTEVITDSSMVRQALIRVITSMRCTSNVATVNCTCNDNRLVFTLICEGGIFSEASNAMVCNLNGNIVPEAVANSGNQSLPKYRSMALVLAERICNSLNGKLELKSGKSKLENAILSFPLH